jgi:hypothetical protein
MDEKAPKRIGLTSSGNAAFVRGLQCYSATLQGNRVKEERDNGLKC